MTGAEGVNFCTVKVDMTKCTLCMECVHTCPNDALTFDGDVVVFMHSAYECAYCEVCMDVCEPECLEILEM